MNSGQKAAMTRRINELSKLASECRGDRGLWENIDEEGLARNKRFLKNIEDALHRLQRLRSEADGR